MDVRQADVKTLREIADDLRDLAARLDATLEAKAVPALGKIADSEVARRVAAGICLTCDKKPVSRGLCYACRKEATRKVSGGDYTESDLISANMLLPIPRPGRRAESGFAKHVTASTSTARAKATANDVKVEVTFADDKSRNHTRKSEIEAALRGKRIGYIKTSPQFVLPKRSARHMRRHPLTEADVNRFLATIDEIYADVAKCWQRLAWGVWLAARLGRLARWHVSGRGPHA